MYTILLYNVGRGLPAISRVIGDSCEITLHKTRFKRDVGIFIFLKKKTDKTIDISFVLFLYLFRLPDINLNLDLNSASNRFVEFEPTNEQPSAIIIQMESYVFL